MQDLPLPQKFLTECPMDFAHWLYQLTKAFFLSK